MAIPSSTTIESSAAGAAAPESLLVRYIKAHIKQGEQAKERADQSREKAEQHFIAAGQYLATLKANYAPTWEAWEALLKAKVGLSTSRASELMQIGNGRKTVEQVRTSTAQRVMKHAKTSSSLASRTNEEKELRIHTIIEEDGRTTRRATKADIAKIKAAQAAHHDFLEEIRRQEAQAKAVADQMVAENSHFIRQLFKAIDEFADFLNILHRQQQEAPAALSSGDGPEHRLIDALVISNPGIRSAAAQLLISGTRQGQYEPVTHAVADLYQILARAGR